MASSPSPLACLTLAVGVVVPKEVLAVEAGDLIAWGHVPQSLDTGRVLARRDKLACRPAVRDGYMYTVVALTRLFRVPVKSLLK